MRLGADSWLFFKVAEKDDAAMRLLRVVDKNKTVRYNYVKLASKS